MLWVYGTQFTLHIHVSFGSKSHGQCLGSVSGSFVEDARIRCTQVLMCDLIGGYVAVMRGAVWWRVWNSIGDGGSMPSNGKTQSNINRCAVLLG